MSGVELEAIVVYDSTALGLFNGNEEAQSEATRGGGGEGEMTFERMEEVLPRVFESYALAVCVYGVDFHTRFYCPCALDTPCPVLTSRIGLPDSRIPPRIHAWLRRWRRRGSGLRVYLPLWLQCLCLC